MGLFSSSKKSSTTSNTTNNSTSLGIQGDLSGILGDGNSIFSDNSDRSTEIDLSLDYQQDNSDNSRVDLNLENTGILAGATVTGNVTLTDGGAFAFGRDVVNQLGATMQTALKNATEQTYLATRAAEQAAANALAFGADSLRSVENTSRYALDTNRATSKEAIQGVLYASEEANKAIAEQTKRLSETASSATQDAINASNKAMERNAALIQTTALGGQDLMIEGMQKSLMYLGGFLALGFVAMAWGRK